MPSVYEADGQRYTVTLTPDGDNLWHCRIDEQEYWVEAHALGDDRWLLRHEGQQFVVHSAHINRVASVHLEGQHYTLTQPDPRTRRKSSATGGDLTAQMPGQITDVRVRVGDTVTSGTVLLVMEAMKMEIRVVAPSDGVVAALHVEKGQLVQRGQPLAEVQAVSS